MSYPNKDWTTYKNGVPRSHMEKYFHYPRTRIKEYDADGNLLDEDWECDINDGDWGDIAIVLEEGETFSLRFY